MSRRLIFVLTLVTALLPLLLAAEQPIAVKTVPLEQLVIYPETSVPATVVSLGDSRIGAELNAPIQAIAVRVGDIVEAGGMLVRLDCADYRLTVEELEARLARTEATLTFARQQLQRARSLEQQRTISQELLDERESNMTGLIAERNANRATLAKARRDREKCDLKAPFRAVVMERLASVGEYAMPGSPLIRVLDIEHLEVSAAVRIGDAQPLTEAKMLVFRHEGRDYPMVLRTLTPVIDPLSRTREARLLFAEETALPGAAGRLVWTVGAALPPDYLVRRNGGLGVLVAENGKARFHPIPQAQEGRPTPIDLVPNTPIVTEGRFILDDGDPITIVD